MTTYEKRNPSYVGSHPLVAEELPQKEPGRGTGRESQATGEKESVQETQEIHGGESARFPGIAALLLLLAGIILAFPSVSPVMVSSRISLLLLTAGMALLLAGFLIMKPILQASLIPLVRGKQIITLVLLAASAYALRSKGSLPPVETVSILGLAVLAVFATIPDNPLMPFAAVTAVLAGIFAPGTGIRPPLLIPAAAFGGAAILSFVALQAQRTRRAYAASRASLENENERLLQEVRRITEPAAVAQAVLTATEGFAAALEPGEILEKITNGTRSQLRAVGSLLLVWDDTHETLRVGSTAGPKMSAAADLHDMDVRTDGVPTLRGTSPGRFVDVTPEMFREPVLQSLLTHWKASHVVGVRLERAGSFLGLLFVCRGKGSSAFSTRDRKILSGIAVHAVAALAHANLISDLRNAYQIKEEFMATMSHELRTPLNVIIGYTDLQLEGVFGELEPDHLDAVQRTREQGLQLLELIQATLDMSRLERGMMSVDLRDVSISDFMELLRTQIPSSWKKPTVELSWGIMPGLPTIRTDPSKLQIILRNLIHNALKFTNNGVVNVTVSAKPNQKEVTFVVQDTGVGIRAEHLSQVFDMFRQIPQSDAVPGGVGLGLYIVRRFAHVLGIDIDVSSAPGRGTTFRVHAPVGGPLATLHYRGKDSRRNLP